jgi:hypothetical protein
MAETIFLTDTPRALRAHGVQCSYLTLWRRVVAGDVPASRVGNRWAVSPADLPLIAQTLSKA